MEGGSREGVRKKQGIHSAHSLQYVDISGEPLHSNVFWTPWLNNFPKIPLSMYCSPANFWNVALECSPTPFTTSTLGNLLWHCQPTVSFPFSKFRASLAPEPCNQWTDHQVYSVLWLQDQVPRDEGQAVYSSHPHGTPIFVFPGCHRGFNTFLLPWSFANPTISNKTTEIQQNTTNVTIKLFLPHLFLLWANH